MLELFLDIYNTIFLNWEMESTEYNNDCKRIIRTNL